MSFILVAVRPQPDGSVKEEELSACAYETGKEAAAAAAAKAIELGCKVQPRRKKVVEDWRPKAKRHHEELLARFGAGIAFPSSWKGIIEPLPDHFAYLDPSDPSNVRFIASDEHGAQLRFTVTTVGRYLTEFFPGLTDEVKKRLIASVDPRGTLHLATTPDEVERIYDVGPQSCMKGDAGRVMTDEGEKLHRARMYAGPDLAVAYVEAKGQITARVVVWPEKKKYGRIYGDASRMSALLKQEGYTDTSHFDGARISEVITNPKGVREHGEEPIHHSSYFDNIRGLIVDKDRQMRAGNQKQIEEMQSGKSHYGLYTNDTTKRGGERMVGQSIGVWCPVLRSYQPEKTFVDVTAFGGIDGFNRVSKKAADERTFECAILKQRFGKQLMVQVGDETWCRAVFEERGATCAYTGKNCPKADLVPARDGALVAKDVLKAYHKHLDAKEAFAKRIADRVEAFAKNPTDKIVVTIEDLDDRTADGIKRYYEVVTGRRCGGERMMPEFDIDGRNIIITVK